MVRVGAGPDQQNAPGDDTAGAQDYRGVTFVFDLDGTLCDTDGREYSRAHPKRDRIELVNDLYRRGARIIVDTARGSGTNENWQAKTEAQLKGWGLKFHRVRTGIKFAGDFYIDDKAQSDREFFNDRRRID